MQLPNHSGADAIVAFATEWAFLDHLAYAHNQYGGNVSYSKIGNRE
jgi:hypothetical protein